MPQSWRGRGEGFISRRTWETYEAESVYARVLLNIFHYVATRHPVRNELERSHGNTPEWDYVWVLPVLPHDSLLVELWILFLEW